MVETEEGGVTVRGYGDPFCLSRFCSMIVNLHSWRGEEEKRSQKKKEERRREKERKTKLLRDTTVHSQRDQNSRAVVLLFLFVSFCTIFHQDMAFIGVSCVHHQYIMAWGFRRLYRYSPNSKNYFLKKYLFTYFANLCTQIAVNSSCFVESLKLILLLYNKLALLCISIAEAIQDTV